MRTTRFLIYLVGGIASIGDRLVQYLSQSQIFCTPTNAAFPGSTWERQKKSIDKGFSLKLTPNGGLENNLAIFPQLVAVPIVVVLHKVHRCC